MRLALGISYNGRTYEEGTADVDALDELYTDVLVGTY